TSCRSAIDAATLPAHVLHFRRAYSTFIIRPGATLISPRGLVFYGRREEERPSRRSGTAACFVAFVVARLRLVDQPDPVGRGREVDLDAPEVVEPQLVADEPVLAHEADHDVAQARQVGEVDLEEDLGLALERRLPQDAHRPVLLERLVVV